MLRNNPRVFKNQFGHVLVIAGFQRMLGAAALTSLAAMRCGAGLVTVGIPRSLNPVIQKKISNVIMTWPLIETRAQTIAVGAFQAIRQNYNKFNAIAIGPGLSTNASTEKFVSKIISTSPIPLVIDADALNALSRDPKILLKTKTPKILTPHPGEMARLLKTTTKFVEKNRKANALQFAQKYKCTIVLKGHRSVIADETGRIHINTTGNAGMATAGSGDVLTGMIAAFFAQGLNTFEAAQWATYLHGRAGDLAAKAKTRLCLIASDILDFIPEAVKFSK